MGIGQKLAVVLWMVAFNLTTHVATAIEVIHDNATSSPILKAIQSAKSSIDIEIYEIEDLRVQNAILNALKNGVKVRIIQESEAVGSNCAVFEKQTKDDTLDCLGQKALVQKVKSMGGSYVPFAYQQFCSEGNFRCLEHGKIILIDQKKALISTGNFNATNLCDPKGTSGTLTTCNRDYTVVSEDSNIVATLLAVFNADLRGNSYDLPKILKTKAAEKVTVSPYSLNPLLQFINSAKKSIMIENQYLKNVEFNSALIAAAKRGVDVYVMVSSICSFGKPDPKADAASIDQWKNIYKAFDKAGIRSRMFTRQIRVNGYNGYLHAKSIVVDGARAWVGSVNGSTQALTMNREYGVFIDDSEQVKKLAKFMAQDFTDPNSETWQESLLCKKDI